jgi:hypothetical protein
MTKPCQGCKPHAYQDVKYGRNVRVHNITVKRDPTVYRCTVCGKESSK